MNTLSERYGDRMFTAFISKSVEAQKSVESRIPLCMTDCKLGTEYKNLTMEVLERC